MFSHAEESLSLSTHSTYDRLSVPCLDLTRKWKIFGLHLYTKFQVRRLPQTDIHKHTTTDLIIIIIIIIFF